MFSSCLAIFRLCLTSVAYGQASRYTYIHPPPDLSMQSKYWSSCGSLCPSHPSSPCLHGPITWLSERFPLSAVCHPSASVSASRRFRFPRPGSLGALRVTRVITLSRRDRKLERSHFAKISASGEAGGKQETVIAPRRQRCVRGRIFVSDFWFVVQAYALVDDGPVYCSMRQVCP